MMKYVSFDIFDTCLIRQCGDAKNVFFLLGRKLFGTETTEAEMFFHWRCHAEDMAVKKFSCKNVTIEEIYSLIPHEIAGKYTCEQLVEEEMSLESGMLHSVLSTKKIVRELREKNISIVFVSDMYLPSSFLLEILCREGVAELGDACFVSCECKASKSSGSLYAQVINHFNAKPICHYGDNLWSDVYMAKKAGINTCQIYEDFNEVEKQILLKSKHKRNFQYYSCLVGAMRFARLTHKGSLSPDISADFVAPIFTAYVLACLKKAEKEHLNRLYFLARDGYILLWIAQHFASLFPDIDIRYLYVSRKSMYLPSLTDISNCELEKYFGEGFKYCSKRQFLKYFKQKEWDEKNVLAEAFAARKRIEDYFVSEDLYNANIKYALVDVGWKGSGRYAFNKLMRLKGSPEREMWYWGTFYEWRMSFEGNFWTYNTNLDLPIYFITLIEDYFSTSPDLSTIDYEGGKPVFDETSKIDNLKILETNKACIEAFIQIMKDFDICNQEILDEISSICCNILVRNPEFINLKPLSEMNCFSECGCDKGLVYSPKLIDVVKYAFGSNTYRGWMEANLAFSCKALLNPLRFMRSSCLRLKRKIR